jgi:hypothetical protein
MLCEVDPVSSSDADGLREGWLSPGLEGPE